MVVISNKTKKWTIRGLAIITAYFAIAMAIATFDTPVVAATAPALLMIAAIVGTVVLWRFSNKYR